MRASAGDIISRVASGDTISRVAEGDIRNGRIDNWPTLYWETLTASQWSTLTTRQWAELEADAEPYALALQIGAEGDIL